MGECHSTCLDDLQGVGVEADVIEVIGELRLEDGADVTDEELEHAVGRELEVADELIEDLDGVVFELVEVLVVDLYQGGLLIERANPLSQLFDLDQRLYLVMKGLFDVA